MPGLDQVGEAGFQDRDDAVLERGAVQRRDGAGLALRHPVGQLVAAEQVAGIGEGRHEAAVG